MILGEDLNKSKHNLPLAYRCLPSWKISEHENLAKIFCVYISSGVHFRLIGKKKVSLTQMSDKHSAPTTLLSLASLAPMH